MKRYFKDKRPRVLPENMGVVGVGYGPLAKICLLIVSLTQSDTKTI